MCLSTVALKLTYNKAQRAFIGVGYKNIESEYVKDGKILWSELPSCYGKGWKDSFLYKGKQDGSFARSKIDYTVSSDDDINVEYAPGFHIFLNQEDAELYGAAKYGAVIKVEFKEVLAYGENYNGEQDGPCVVARRMRVVELVKEPQNYEDD